MSVPQQSLSLILCNLSATTSAPSPTSLPTLSSSKRDLHLPPRLRILLFEDSPRIAFLAEKVRKLLYEISRELLRGIMARDSCSLLGLSGGWPTVFLPVDEYCRLCHSPLGRETNHPGQQSNDAYLIMELNAFL